MSAPALAIVPPDVPAAPTLPAADRQRTLRRMRTAGTSMAVTGALLPVASTAAAPWLHEWEYLGIMTSYALLVPFGGLALLVCAAATRSRDDVKAMLLSLAVFVGGIALLAPAARAGMEAYVSSHATELDALAARVRATVPADLEPGGDGRLSADATVQAAITREMREHRLRAALPVDGGIVFSLNDVPFGSDLFYADDVASPNPFPCRGLRAIGGRWYMGECPIGRSDYSD